MGVDAAEARLSNGLGAGNQRDDICRDDTGEKNDEGGEGAHVG